MIKVGKVDRIESKGTYCGWTIMEDAWISKYDTALKSILTNKIHTVTGYRTIRESSYSKRNIKKACLKMEPQVIENDILTIYKLKS